jgi:MFS transporter, DHA1 family, multidrug resistance protein
MGLAEIAVLVSLNVAVSMLIKPYAGHIADRMGFKRGAVIAIIARSVVTLLFAFTGIMWQLFALQTARGFAKSLRDPAMSALIAEHAGERRIASAFAWYKTATSAAGALGKALAGVLLTLTASSFPFVFGVAFLFSILPIVAVARYVPATPHIPAKATTSGTSAVAAALPAGWSRLWPAMGFGFLVSGTANMLRGLFPILAVEYGGLTPAETGIVYLVATATTLATGPIFGWLADNLSRRLVLMARSIANVAASAVYLAFPSFPGFAAGKAVDEAGKAAFNPAWGSLMTEISGTDRARRGRIMGWLDAADDAGAIAGPILAGLLWTAGGVGVLLTARIGLAIAAEVYAVLLLSKATTAAVSDNPQS